MILKNWFKDIAFIYLVTLEIMNCLDKKTEFKMYKENFERMKKLPFVKYLLKQNKKLEKENEDLKNTVLKLCKKVLIKEEEKKENIVYKIEETDDDVVILEEVKKEDIVELIEEEEEEQEEGEEWKRASLMVSKEDDRPLLSYC